MSNRESLVTFSEIMDYTHLSAIEEIYPNTDIIMEIPDTDCAKALKKAKEIAESCTEGFGSSVTRRLLTALLYVRFSKDSSIEEKSFVEALRLDTSNLIIDCRKDNGKKWSGMNTLLKCLLAN